MVTTLSWALANQVFTSWPFVVLIVVVIGGASWWIVGPLLRAGRQIRATMRRMSETIGGAPSPAELPLRYEAIDETLRAEPIAGEAWAAFDATLAKPIIPGRPFRQTVPASEFFNLELLKTAGADMRSALAYANTLVGIGLFLTFIGLVLALWAAGESLGATDPNEVRSGLQQLLGASATKFLFSIIGLGSSLLFSSFLRRVLRATEREIQAFVRLIDLKMPPISAQELALESNDLLNSILREQQQYSADLAASLGTKIDDSLNSRLAEHMLPLREAVERMAASMADMNRGALDEMIQRFIGQLEGAAGSQIREVTSNLEKVGAQIGSVASGLAEVQLGLAAAGRTAAEGIGSAMADASGRMASSADLARQSIEAAGKDIREASTDAAAALRGGIQDSMQDVRRAMDESATGFADKLSASAGEMRTSLEQATDSFATRLSSAADNLVTSVRQAVIDLSGAASSAAHDIAKVSVSTSTDFRVAVDAARQAIGTAATAFADETTRAGREIGSVLGSFQTGMSALDGRLREAEGAFAAANSAMANTAEAVGGALRGLDQAAGRLSEASGHIPRAVVELQRMAETMAASMTAQRGLHQDASALADRMVQALGRFEALDGSLANVFEELSRGINAFRDQVRDFVRDTDEGMAKAAEQLRGAIDSLTEALEDVRPALAREAI
ncbi:anti-phage ZorAB system protein ZorA [Falsiroseomonas stagni]|uniref:Methyl-accepting chemotaxis protein n=1 Tax=Falsiroseomonas stagni DSM 19981 TaxID=1123062 RepID=A0A1I3XFJ9_9PROT|nr:anti-phage ZorAB system protein ZorA [Falsiroseomonas stagni]SFK18099.1 hypothetical protein SAMN02745775_101246 [Falsiroseomonas stagni DSM 19981]